MTDLPLKRMIILETAVTPKRTVVAVNTSDEEVGKGIELTRTEAQR